MLVGVPAAWAFARFTFPSKKVLFMLYIVLMMMPFQVTMLSSYLVLDNMGLMNTQMSVILPGIFSTFPIFIMYRTFCELPKGLIEAAKMDGAGEVKIFIKIGIPLGSSGILSALVLGFLEYWSLTEQPLAFFKDRTIWRKITDIPIESIEEDGERTGVYHVYLPVTSEMGKIGETGSMTLCQAAEEGEPVFNRISIFQTGGEEITKALTALT